MRGAIEGDHSHFGGVPWQFQNCSLIARFNEELLSYMVKHETVDEAYIEQLVDSWETIHWRTGRKFERTVTLRLQQLRSVLSVAVQPVHQVEDELEEFSQYDFTASMSASIALDNGSADQPAHDPSHEFVRACFHHHFQFR